MSSLTYTESIFWVTTSPLTPPHITDSTDLTILAFVSLMSSLTYTESIFWVTTSPLTPPHITDSTDLTILAFVSLVSRLAYTWAIFYRGHNLPPAPSPYNRQQWSYHPGICLLGVQACIYMNHLLGHNLMHDEDDNHTPWNIHCHSRSLGKLQGGTIWLTVVL